MLMLFLFPIGLVAAMVALVADAIRFGSLWRVRQSGKIPKLRYSREDGLWRRLHEIKH